MSEGGFDSLLSSVLGNEELMKRISGIASSHSENTDDALPEVIEAIASSINTPRTEDERHEPKRDEGSKGAKRFDHSKSSRLLTALKPYLSDKRAQMIDSILRVEQIAEIIKITR